jgi:hypothetical protein
MEQISRIGIHTRPRVTARVVAPDINSPPGFAKMKDPHMTT